MARATLGQRMDRQYRRVAAAPSPEDGFLAAVDAVKALAASLENYGNEEDATGVRQDASDALMDVFTERLARLGAHLPSAPAPVPEGTSPR